MKLSVNKFKYKMVLLCLISVILLTISKTRVMAAENKSHFFVMKSTDIEDKFISDMKINYPGIKMTFIKEIGAFTIESNNKYFLKEVKDSINTKYKNDIKADCTDEEISLQDIKKEEEQGKIDCVELNDKYEFWRWDIDRVTNKRSTYNIEEGNHDVKVAVIDSGIDIQHPDLKNNIVINKSCVPGKEGLEDSIGHGTMVAGEIAANGNVKGVAPKVGIASYKVFDGDNCESSWVVQAIIQAANDNIDVINLSLGTYKSLINKDDLALVIAYERAILYAQIKGCVVVTASGNQAKGLDISDSYTLAEKLGEKDDLQVYLPGSLPNVITVSATNRDDKITGYSNYGYTVDIAAPGGDYGPRWETEEIPDLKYMALVTVPTTFDQSQLSSLLKFDKGYEFIEGGTSLAAPKVSAAAALLIAAYKSKYCIKPSQLQVEQWLYNGADKIPGNKSRLYYGNGILNVKKSLKNI